MCGIAGLFLPKSAPPITADIDRMLAVMRHRGPDGTATHASADRRFQCGFARLAIIDIETGGQPLVDNGRGLCFLGNGEIYNYREIRARLPGPFRTEGDMEPALALFTAKGPDFLDDLNGMFALAVHEEGPHRLLLARDRLGIKPLYWSRLAGGGLLFASEVKALFASGLIEPRLHADAVSSYLGHGYVPAPDTLFAGIHKLPPGHRLIAEADGTMRIERWWRPQPAADLPTDEAGISAHLEHLLADSVRLQLRSDVPVGALLSGGIDSGLMVALAAGAMDRPLNTYTVRFEGGGADETPLARMVAERYATRHTEFSLSVDAAADLLPRLAWFADEPLFDAALLPNHLIAQHLASEVRVVLNGTGGDELFAGYGRYFPLPIERRFLALPGWLRRSSRALVSPMTAWQLARAEKFGTDRGGYLFDHTTQFPEPLRRLLGNRQAPPVPAQRAFFTEFPGPADSAALAADLGTYLPEDLLLLLDRTTMANSVEGRVPFLDHRLCEAALAVPPAIRAPGGRQKALERAIAARHLPEAILTAPKRGFASPVPAWMEGRLGGAAKRLLASPKTLERGFWHREGIERLFADPRRHAFRLYALVMLELAIRLTIEHPRAEAPTASLAEIADEG